jgi:hypothetical protein
MYQFNSLSKNLYDVDCPGYLSEYSPDNNITRIIPDPIWVCYERMDLPKKPYLYCVLVAFNGDVPYPIDPKGKKKLPYLYTGSGNSGIGDEYSSDDSGNGTVKENSTQVEPETAAESVNAVYTQRKKRARRTITRQQKHPCSGRLVSSGDYDRRCTPKEYMR